MNKPGTGASAVSRLSLGSFDIMALVLFRGGCGWVCAGVIVFVRFVIHVLLFVGIDRVGWLTNIKTDVSCSEADNA